MATFDAPLRFEPYLRPMVWGGRRLGTLLGKSLPTDENFGESWEISDHPSHPTVVAEGPLAGTSVRRLMEDHATDLASPGALAPGVCGPLRQFPWLIKFLDARDWLSIQVHPDDAKARQLCPGENGKTEAWLILAADTGSRIWAGLRPGVVPDQFRQALETGRVVDCLHSFQPEPGQCLFLPAGTVHAVGGGVVLAEVQQTSDATFRLFDWNRRDAKGQLRPLHIDQSLAAIDWSRGPVEPIRIEGFRGPGRHLQAGPAQRQALVQCPFFTLSYLRLDHKATLGGGRLTAIIVLAGQGRWENGPPVTVGQTWLLPACLPPQTLRCEVPMELWLAEL